MTRRSDGSIDQLLRRAVVRIEGLGLDVVAVIDHSGDAAEAGVTIPEAKLVLFGSPSDAIGLLPAHPASRSTSPSGSSSPTVARATVTPSSATRRRTTSSAATG